MPTPQKETPASGDNHTAGVNTQITGTIVTDQVLSVQRLMALSMMVTLAGYVINKLGTGYTISRWGNVIYCADFEALEHQLQTLKTGPY